MCDFTLFETAVSVSFPTILEAFTRTPACLSLALASTTCIVKQGYTTNSTKPRVKTGFVLFPNIEIVNFQIDKLPCIIVANWLISCHNIILMSLFIDYVFPQFLSLKLSCFNIQKLLPTCLCCYLEKNG